MKTIAALLLLVVLTGCTDATEYGECIGIGQDKNPNLEYKIDGWNLAIGIIFFELVAPPVIVAADETFCPVGKK